MSSIGLKTLFSQFEDSCRKIGSRDLGITDLIDQKFSDEITAISIERRIPRDILPFCGKVMKITDKVMRLASSNEQDFIDLKEKWEKFIKRRASDGGIIVYRHQIPPIRLTFPFSQASLNGESLKHREIKILDPDNSQEFNRVKLAISRIQTISGFYFSNYYLESILKMKESRCVYSETLSGRITGFSFGMDLNLKVSEDARQVRVFHPIFIAREPECRGYDFYNKYFNKMIEKNDKKYDFFYWKEGEKNPSNIRMFASRLQGKAKVESYKDPGAYPFEKGKRCIAKITNEDLQFPTPQLIRKTIGHQLISSATSKLKLLAVFIYDFILSTWYKIRYPLGHQDNWIKYSITQCFWKIVNPIKKFVTPSISC